MPRINLLPIKAAKRNESARNELMVITLLFVALLGGLYYFHQSVEQEIAAIDNRLGGVSTDINNLKKEAGRVEEFERKSKVLQTKLDTIEKLKRQKVGPVMLLNDLATILTQLNKVWLSSITEQDGMLVFEGGAMNHEDISDFQLGLTKQSKFFSDVKLALVQASTLDGIRHLRWKITCKADFSAG